MAKLVIVFACVALFQIASALECYHCDRESCEKDMKDWTKAPCGKLANQDNVCLKFVYKDATSQKEVTSRKCVGVDKNGKYQCPATGEQIFCDTCNTDLCNSAAGVSLSFAAISGIFLALLAPKFFA